MQNRMMALSLLAFLCLTTGCLGQTPVVNPGDPRTAIPASATVVRAEDSARTLTVLAASSLTEAFKELAALFEAQNPGVRVDISFAGSQQLAQQLDQGADADVFASASKKYMDAAIASGRVQPDDSKIFAKNRLVVIYPGDNPGGLKDLTDLAKTGLKLDLANESVPAGQYTMDFLDRAVQHPKFGKDFKDKVLANVVSYEENVKSVVTKIVLGEADAGVVYVTDITREAGGKIGQIDIPDELNTTASYPIASVMDSEHAQLARVFVALVLSPEGQAVIARYGFIPAGDGSE